MSLSPLAEQIYRTLVRRIRLSNPLISYGDLVRALGHLPSPHTDLKPNDRRLFEALGEVSRACSSHKPPLPALTSIVVRQTEDGSLGTPGPGYFTLVFPHVRDDTARLQMWRRESRRVAAASYPDLWPSGPYPSTDGDTSGSSTDGDTGRASIVVTRAHRACRHHRRGRNASRGDDSALGRHAPC